MNARISDFISQTAYRIAAPEEGAWPSPLEVQATMNDRADLIASLEAIGCWTEATRLQAQYALFGKTEDLEVSERAHRKPCYV